MSAFVIVISKSDVASDPWDLFALLVLGIQGRGVLTDDRGDQLLLPLGGLCDLSDGHGRHLLLELFNLFADLLLEQGI